MNAVKIADLKAHLSEHLRTVRAGEVVTIYDRNVPIAQLVPIRRPLAALEHRPPERPLSAFVNPEPVEPGLDILTELAVERERDRRR
jgi:prevent-host-death family protein